MARLSLLLLAAAALAHPPLRAQTAPPPFTFDKAYSADQVFTGQNGMMITSKIYSDGGRLRSEMQAQGMNIVALILPDQHKAYSLMPDEKMALVMPYDAEKYQKFMVGTSGFDGRIEPLAPETVEGVACEKYKVTAGGKFFFLWVDPAKKQPVKLAAPDGSFTLFWRNYQAGPQPASLFEIPPGYQVMDMPAGMGRALPRPPSGP